MLVTRWAYALSGMMVVAAVALSGCSDTTGCTNCAPLDYQSNSARVKYGLEDRTAVNGVRPFSLSSSS